LQRLFPANTACPYSQRTVAACGSLSRSMRLETSRPNIRPNFRSMVLMMFMTFPPESLHRDAPRDKEKGAGVNASPSLITLDRVRARAPDCRKIPVRAGNSNKDGKMRLTKPGAFRVVAIDNDHRRQHPCSMVPIALTRDHLPDDSPSLLREVARLHVRAQREALAGDGARTTECTILTELGRAPGMTLAQLSRRLRIDKGWTSRAVDQLLEEGLVEKAPDASDRRLIALSLTRAGQARHHRLEVLLNEQVGRVIRRVPRAARAAVRRALLALHRAYLSELAHQSAAPKAEEANRSCATT
jgi:DNA-binding MarR family transcriptional regulator